MKHTAVSYYGFNYVEHAEKDFQEMIDHGCDTVILAITEFDMDFWFPNINVIVKKAHEMGLRVLADLLHCRLHLFFRRNRIEIKVTPRDG